MSPHPLKHVVIVGGGVAGLAVARYLSAFGVRSTIVEKQPALGGHVREWACMATDRCLRCFSCSVADLLAAVTESPCVAFLPETALSRMTDEAAGVRQVTVARIKSGQELAMDVSALVLAVGFEPYDPSDKGFWGYGQIPNRVLTLRDLDRLVKQDDLSGFVGNVSGPLRIAFFQCVGSRDRSIGANYCSRHCCKAALRMALRLRHDHADWDISIFYVDLQVAGKFGAALLEEARSADIRLIQGVPGEILPVDDGMLEVIRQQGGLNLRERFHRVVLSIGQRPSATLSGLASITGMGLDEFGYLASNGTLNSGRTSVPGLYVAGACSGPMDIEETLLHAGQTAAAIVADLGVSGEGGS